MKNVAVIKLFERRNHLKIAQKTRKLYFVRFKIKL